MDLDTFLDTVDTLDKRCWDTLILATKEHAHTASTFAHFDTLATVLRILNPALTLITPGDIAMVLLFNHLLSLGKDLATWEDRTGLYVDVLNTLKLHYGMFLQDTAARCTLRPQ